MPTDRLLLWCRSTRAWRACLANTDRKRPQARAWTARWAHFPPIPRPPRVMLAGQGSTPLRRGPGGVWPANQAYFRTRCTPAGVWTAARACSRAGPTRRPAWHARLTRTRRPAGPRPAGHAQPGSSRIWTGLRRGARSATPAVSSGTTCGRARRAGLASFRGWTGHWPARPVRRGHSRRPGRRGALSVPAGRLPRGTGLCTARGAGPGRFSAGPGGLDAWDARLGRFLPGKGPAPA